MNPVLSVFKGVNNLPHIFQIVATVAIGASLFFVSWWLSTQGWLEMASTAVAFFIMQVIRMSGASMTKVLPREMPKTASTIDTLRQEFGEWIANNRLAANMILAVIFTGLFLVGRLAASGVMTLIASPLLAVAIGLAVTAVVVSPVLFRAMLDTFKREETQPHAGEGQSAADHS